MYSAVVAPAKVAQLLGLRQRVASVEQLELAGLLEALRLLKLAGCIRACIGGGFITAR